MGAKSSKLPPRRIQSEVTAVEMFQDATPEAPRESSYLKRQKAGLPAQSVTMQVVRSILQEPSRHTIASEPTGTQTKEEAAATEEKHKKKRRRSKKEKSKLPPPKLVRAHTQLNELKNVKPLLQQSPQARQQHFEQIKDAYALDEEAKKPPQPDVRPRFYHLESWRRTPQTPSSKGDSPTAEPAASLTRHQMTGVQRDFFASSGRSSRGTEEISNDLEDLEDSGDLSDGELLPIPPASRMTAITSPIIITTPSFLAASNQVEFGRLDIQTTPVIRVKTSERRTPERSKRSLRSQRSDLRIDDVDEDLMEHILTNDDH